MSWLSHLVLACLLSAGLTFQCFPQCRTEESSSGSSCVCSSNTANALKLIVACASSTKDHVADSCSVKCEQSLGPESVGDIASIGLDLSNVTLLSLICTSSDSYVDVMLALNATRVQSLTVEAVNANPTVLTNRAFANLHTSAVFETLRSVVLKGDGLKGIESHQVLAPFSLVSKLAIRATDVVSLPNQCFSLMRNLSALAITENDDLTSLPDDLFANLTEVTNLDLSDNHALEILPDSLLYPMTNLREVYINKNRLQYFPKFLFAKNIKLEEIKIMDDNCMQSCKRNFSSDFLRNLSALEEFQYGSKGNENVLYASFPIDFFKDAVNLQGIIFANVILPNGDLSLIKSISHLKRLRLERSRLSNLDCSQLPPSLRDLFLDRMNLNCSCMTLSCLYSLGPSSGVLRDVDRIRVSCNGTDLKAVTAYEQLCQQGNVVVMAAAVACALVFTAVAVFLVYFVFKCRRKMGRINSLDESNYRYDVFVSYVEEDEDFTEKMILNLEVDERLKCCFHKRDFFPGTPIVDNIVQSVKASRTVMLVVSKHFLQSDWCQHELLEASSRHKIILVIMRSDPSVRVSMDQLQATPSIYDHIRAVTYLAEDDTAFQQKLLNFIRFQTVGGQMQRLRTEALCDGSSAKTYRELTPRDCT